MRYFVVLILFMVVAGFAKTALAQDKMFNFEKDGYERRYLVHVPKGREGQENLPVVLNLHGGGGNIESATRQRTMFEVSDKHGFLLVFPEGTGTGKFHAWNGGHCCGKAMEDNVDDVGYISEIIDRLAQDYKIDKTRVYAAGLSNGALMSYRLSCELSDKIAAIVPVASQISLDECKPKRAVPTFHIHGTKDICSAYEGGECGGCFADFFRSFWIPMKRVSRQCLPVRNTIADRAKLYKCNMTPQVTYQKGDITCETYSECQGGSEVTLCTVEGGGHSWPGEDVWPKFCDSKPNGSMCLKWKEGIGHASMDMNGPEAMWHFVSKFTLSDRKLESDN